MRDSSPLGIVSELLFDQEVRFLRTRVVRAGRVESVPVPEDQRGALGERGDDVRPGADEIVARQRVIGNEVDPGIVAGELQAEPVHSRNGGELVGRIDEREPAG